jgi:hypothetical protein
MIVIPSIVIVVIITIIIVMIVVHGVLLLMMWTLGDNSRVDIIILRVLGRDDL